MTGVARQRGVRPDQRKTILMLFDVLNGNLPSLHGVTVLAFRSHLAAMNVCVAVVARLPHLSENHLDVASGAGH